MKKKYLMLSFVLFSVIFTIQNCLSDSVKQTQNNATSGQTGFNETFRKTGWITESKYRAVIFIITDEECKNSSQSDIEERIRFEAYKNLNKELSPSFNRNASSQIKNLADNFGKLIKSDKGCIDGNVYFFDIEKSDLKKDFEKIKNLK